MSQQDKDVISAGVRGCLALTLALAAVWATPMPLNAAPNVVDFPLDPPPPASPQMEGDLVVERLNGVNDGLQGYAFGFDFVGFDAADRAYTTQAFAQAANPAYTGLPDNAFFPATSFHPALQLRFRAGPNWGDYNENTRVFTTSVSPNNSFEVDVTDLPYSRMHLVVAASEGPATLDIQTRYSDTTTDNILLTVPSWTTDLISETLDVYYLAEGVTVADSEANNPTPGVANLYGVSWVPDQTKTVTSFFVTIASLNASGKLAFFGSFGEIGTAPSFVASAPGGTYGSTYSVALANTGVPTATISLAGGTLPNGLNLESTGVISGTPTLAGTYAFTLAANNGLPLALPVTQTFTLTVSPAPLTATVNASTRTYGSPNPALTYTTTGLVLGDTPSSVLNGALVTTATTTTAIGAYAIVTGTLSAVPNYALTVVPGILTITPAPLTVTAVPLTRTYGSPNPPLTFAASGLVAGDTPATAIGGALTTTGTISAPVGTYPITQGTLTASNYAISYVSAALTITRAPLVVTAIDQVMRVGGPVPTLTVSYTGFVLGETAATALTGSPTCTTTATASSPAGVYPITCTVGTLASPNYTFALVDGALRVSEKPYLLYLPLISNNR
jgi:hypothetical protein